MSTLQTGRAGGITCSNTLCRSQTLLHAWTVRVSIAYCGTAMGTSSDFYACCVVRARACPHHASCRKPGSSHQSFSFSGVEPAASAGLRPPAVTAARTGCFAGCAGGASDCAASVDASSPLPPLSAAAGSGFASGVFGLQGMVHRAALGGSMADEADTGGTLTGIHAHTWVQQCPALQPPFLLAI